MKVEVKTWERKEKGDQEDACLSVLRDSRLVLTISHFCSHYRMLPFYSVTTAQGSH